MYSTIPSAILGLMVFLSSNRSALFHASVLLGGPIAGHRLLQLLDACNPAPERLTRWMGRELVALHRLLTLADVADFDSPAAHHFSLIDPSDPCVAEICLLADQLTDCLGDLIDQQHIDGRDLPLAA